MNPQDLKDKICIGAIFMRPRRAHPKSLSAGTGNLSIRDYGFEPSDLFLCQSATGAPLEKS
jgi:hypothetical protein